MTKTVSRMLAHMDAPLGRSWGITTRSWGRTTRSEEELALALWDAQVACAAGAPMAALVHQRNALPPPPPDFSGRFGDAINVEDRIPRSVLKYHERRMLRTGAPLFVCICPGYTRVSLVLFTADALNAAASGPTVPFLERFTSK